MECRAGILGRRNRRDRTVRVGKQRSQKLQELTSKSPIDGDIFVSSFDFFFFHCLLRVLSKTFRAIFP